MKPHIGSTQRLYALDSLRGLAALLIFFFHFFALYPFERGASLASLSNVVLSYFATGVPLFYALSGLSLYLGFFDTEQRTGLSRLFYIRRFFRIAPLFYLALGFWLIIFHIRGAEIDGPKLITTLTFCFNLIPGLHESYVAAGWSVGVEMIFYAVFPVIIFFVRTLRSSLVFIFGSAALAVWAYSWLVKSLPNSSYPGLSFPCHLVFFATGILAYFTSLSWQTKPIQRRNARWATLGAIAAIGVGVLLLLTTEIVKRPPFLASPSVTRILWTLPVGSLLFICSVAEHNSWIIRLLSKLGEWSYSLYLLHPLVIYFVIEHLRSNPHSGFGAATRFTIWLLISLGCLIICSSVTYALIERPFQRLGRRLADSSRIRKCAAREDSSISSASGFTIRSKTDPDRMVPGFIKRAALPVIIICFCFHIWNSTRGWNHSLLGHYSFRQSQTAISSQYILNGGSILRYETPLFGPPWTIPMEFPLYQTIVAGTAKLLKSALEPTGRGVSLAFFYLSLFAVWMLLKELRLSLSVRVVALIFILTSPLYIFFSSLFLIETTALCFTIGYAAAVIHALHAAKPRSAICVAVILGSFGALAKITTFCVGFGFTSIYLAIFFWERRKEMPSSLSRSFPVIVFSLLLPLGAGVAWNAYADHVKHESPTPMARVIDSRSLADWNFGTVQQRFSNAFWSRMSEHGLRNIVGSTWLVIVALAFVSAIPASRVPFICFFGAYASGPMVFSNLYFVHDYYWCANGIFLLVALAVPLGCAFVASARWQAAASVVTVLIVVGNCWGFYRSQYRTYQQTRDVYITDISKAVQLCTNEADVIMVYGFDWDSSLAYYAKRRAITPWIRGFESDQGTMSAVRSLAKEGRRLGLLVIGGKDRLDPEFISRVTTQYGFAGAPVFDDFKTAIYLPVGVNSFPGSSGNVILGREVASMAANIPPRAWIEDGALVWLLHAPSRLEILLPSTAREISIKFGIAKSAYTSGGNTDGAEFIATILYRDGARQVLAERQLRPFEREQDRGLHLLTASIIPDRGASLLLETRSGSGSSAWDWTLWSDLQVTETISRPRS